MYQVKNKKDTRIAVIDLTRVKLIKLRGTGKSRTMKIDKGGILPER